MDSLTFDSSASPSFDALRSCLRWSDEVPPNFWGESYEKLLDLVIARSFIHKGLPKEEWKVLGSTRCFSELWNEALHRAPNWPGFKRIKLTSSEEGYFRTQLSIPLEKHF